MLTPRRVREAVTAQPGRSHPGRWVVVVFGAGRTVVGRVMAVTGTTATCRR